MASFYPAFRGKCGKRVDSLGQFSDVGDIYTDGSALDLIIGR
jgi:hypothetical protein